MVKVRDDIPISDNGQWDVNAWLDRVCQGHGEHCQASLEHCFAWLKSKQVSQDTLAMALKLADILHPLQADEATLNVALLFPAIEQGAITLSDVARDFKPNIVQLTNRLWALYRTEQKTDLALSSERTFQKKAQDSLHQMLLALSEDMRAVLIRLAIQLRSMRDAVHDEPVIQRRLAQETRAVYGPLANRLGVGQLKWEMEDFAFRYLEPQAYKTIAKQLDEKRLDREQYIERVVTHIQKSMKKAHIEVDITGRVKHIYSIWRKMQRKNLPFESVYDIRAIRLLVPDIQACYAALSVIHQHWQYLPDEFDDYIANPKSNGYRSLHTAVIGPENKIIEVQIRTHDMHREAEMGVAAHWLYKENLKYDNQNHAKFGLLREMLEEQHQKDEALDHDQAHHDLFDSRIYVFTPQGDVINMPKGATALDFAYHVHTDVGHRCRGVKVNGKMVSLTTRLHSGEQVEVLTSATAKPSRDWLNVQEGYLTTTRAKQKVQAWFKRQARETHIRVGREQVEKGLKRMGVHMPTTQLATLLKFPNDEELFVAIGRNDIRWEQVLAAIDRHQVTQMQPTQSAWPDKHPTIPTSPRGHINVQGVTNLSSRFAKCCKPVPGDNIVGYISKMHGLTVHRSDCAQLAQQELDHEQRLIPVQWGQQANTKRYPVDLEILAYDRGGLLKDVATILSHYKINVQSAQTQTHDDGLARITLGIEVTDLPILGIVLSKIMHLPNIIEARRVEQGIPVTPQCSE